VKFAVPALIALVLSACGSKPQAPDWQMNARGALDRFEQAWLTGEQRAAEAEFTRARNELAATGDAALVARAELTRCALQVASLVFEPCPEFELLGADAGQGERAYADYLQGAPVAAQLLPAQHRAVAGGAASAKSVESIDDPLSRLVAAGVLMRSGRGSPELMQLAADTASRQGWRRPLLAWLGAQLKLAEQRGVQEEVARLQRRIALASGQK
jgi:hypothetical protein